MQLSNRLQAVANFVTRGNRVADIGTDHGYVPIYLIQKQIAKSVIAMDVKKGPLERARAHIVEAKLIDKIQIRLSDGLTALELGEAETVIIAGMGGPLMMKILSEGKTVLENVSELVLSPQSNVTEFREYLQENNYKIVRETMVKEDGKYYNIMQVKRGVMNYDRYIYFKYGKLLIEKKHPILQQFLEKEEQKYWRIKLRLKEQIEEQKYRQVKSESEKQIKLADEKIKLSDEILQVIDEKSNIKERITKNKNQKTQLQNRLEEIDSELELIAEVKQIWNLKLSV